MTTQNSTELNSTLKIFIDNVKEHQAVWGLQDDTGDGWVVCDSSEFEATDVMPLWSLQSEAKTHCNEEWENYTPVAISLSELLEYWIRDLNEDGVLIGTDWANEKECFEIEPIELAKHLVEIEKE